MTTPSSTAAPSAPARWGIHARMLGMTLLWGVSWPAGRAIALAMPAITSAAWRFLIAASVLVLWLVLTRGWPRLSRRQWMGLVVGGTIGVFTYAFCFMLALQRVEASRAAMVVTTNPVFTTMLAAWLFKEHFDVRIAVGLVLAMVGAAIVLGHGDPTTLLAGGLGLGEVFLLACIACWTGYTLLGKAVMKGVDPLAVTAITALVGAVELTSLALVLEGPTALVQATRSLTAGLWGTLLVLSLGSTVLAYAWYNRGVAVLGAGKAASWISLVPVIGVASSVLLLGERLEPSLLVGGVLAVAGLVVSNRGRQG